MTYIDIQQAMALTQRSEAVLLDIVREARAGLHPVQVVMIDESRPEPTIKFSQSFLKERFVLRLKDRSTGLAPLQVKSHVGFLQGEMSLKDKQIIQLVDNQRHYYQVWRQAQVDDLSVVDQVTVDIKATCQQYKKTIGTIAACVLFLAAFSLGFSTDDSSYRVADISADQATQFAAMQERIDGLEQNNSKLIKQLATKAEQQIASD